MADKHNFRAAFNGFNREDVVHYIEYITAKHNAQVNQLNSDNALLREQLEQAQAAPAQDPLTLEMLARAERERDDCLAQLAELKARCAELEAQPPVADQAEDQEARITALEEQHRAELAQIQADAQARIQAAEAAKAQAEAQLAAMQSRADQELEAYRRAERTERKARERAEQVYHQANGALADAAAQVDETAAQIGEMADRAIAQLEQLRTAVTGSKEALRTAAVSLSAIRPTAEDE